VIGRRRFGDAGVRRAYAEQLNIKNIGAWRDLNAEFFYFARLARMLTSSKNSWTIAYYDAHVRRDIFELPPGVLSGYRRLADILKIHGADLRMPHSRAMGDGLFELRPRGGEGIGRVFYCTMVGRKIVMLHAFVKKTQRTPEKELRIARARMKEVKQHG
jgi:phage-related protein